MLKLQLLIVTSIPLISAGLFNSFDESWTALEKADAIWGWIEESKGTNADWKPTSDSLINWIVPMYQAFKPTDFVANWYLTGWISPRRKTVHTKGALQKIRYVDVGGHSYTGLFAGDNDYGLLRYSISAKSVYLPGIAFKFYRDGQPSGNIQTVAPYSTNTVQFMSGNFTNHIAESQGTFAKIAASKFAQSSVYTFTMGTSHFATWDAAGNEVSGDPIFPFRIVFEPQVFIDETRTYENVYNNETTADGEDAEEYDFTDPIIDSLTASDQLLFKVYAYENPSDINDSNGAVQIGEVYSQSEAIKSKFGDENVQFFHNSWDWDIAYKPEWKSYVPAMKWNWFAIDWEDETLNDDYSGWDIDTNLTVSSTLPHGCPLAYLF